MIFASLADQFGKLVRHAKNWGTGTITRAKVR